MSSIYCCLRLFLPPLIVECKAVITSRPSHTTHCNICPPLKPPQLHFFKRRKYQWMCFSNNLAIEKVWDCLSAVFDKVFFYKVTILRHLNEPNGTMFIWRSFISSTSHVYELYMKVSIHHPTLSKLPVLKKIFVLNLDLPVFIFLMF